MSAHTPGPWTTTRAKILVDGAYDYAIGANGQIIAEAFGRSGTNCYHDSEANARLIAAAPELLEACRRAEKLIRNGGAVPIGGETWEVLSAAIAKAEGSR